MQEQSTHCKVGEPRLRLSIPSLPAQSSRWKCRGLSPSLPNPVLHRGAWRVSKDKHLWMGPRDGSAPGEAAQMRLCCTAAGDLAEVPS